MHDEFEYVELPDGRRVGRFGLLSGISGVVHAVTTKIGEVFPIDADAGADAYMRLARTLGGQATAWCTQVHGNVVLPVVEAGNAGQADGLTTDRTGLVMLCRSADCVLILAADRAGRCVGVAHASWKGTVAGVAGNLIHTLVKQYGVQPADLIACVGPSAGPNRYEVGPDVYDAAQPSSPESVI